jgi:chorismate mutase/prephenate dehydrogenase
VGGAGRIGRLLGRFFRARGFDVGVLDPSGPPRGFRAASLDDARDADVVVVAASLPRVREALDAVLGRSPRGLVFDVASLKSPVERSLREAASLGVRACSVHPMFGPGVRSLRGHDLIVCDAGSEAACRAARRLFSGAGLSIRTMPIEEHDAWIAGTLGLAHFVALAAGMALASSGVDLARLDGATSTSFRHLLELARPIAEQPAELTRAIQRENPRARETLERFCRSADALKALLLDGPEEPLEAAVESVRTTLDRARRK